MDLLQAADEFLLYLEIERNCSIHTVRAYQLDLLSLTRFMKQYERPLDLPQVTSSLVRRFIQYEISQQGTAHETIQRRISCLKSFSKYCMQQQWIAADFMAPIVRPQREKRLPVTMKRDEAQLMLKTLQSETSPSSQRDFVLIAFVVYTGVRRQELVDLSWRNYDAREKVILIKGKGKKERLIPLHDDVVISLNKYRPSVPPEWQPDSKHYLPL